MIKDDEKIIDLNEHGLPCSFLRALCEAGSLTCKSAAGLSGDAETMSHAHSTTPGPSNWPSQAPSGPVNTGQSSGQGQNPLQQQQQQLQEAWVPHVSHRAAGPSRSQGVSHSAPESSASPQQQARGQHVSHTAVGPSTSAPAGSPSPSQSSEQIPPLVPDYNWPPAGSTAPSQSSEPAPSIPGSSWRPAGVPASQSSGQEPSIPDYSWRPQQMQAPLVPPPPNVTQEDFALLNQNAAPWLQGEEVHPKTCSMLLP